MAFAWTDCGATDLGRVRKINEDAFLALPSLGSAGLWVVADGMGGHEAGDVASSAIVDSLLYLPPNSDFEALIASVTATIERVNTELQQMGHKRDSGVLIGSTVVVFAVHRSGKAVCLWAGDSRLYRLRGDRLARLSRDHSHVQWLIDYGIIAEAQAENHPSANVITNAVGAGETVNIERKDIQVEADDVLLLCSDGVTKEMEDAEIEATLRLKEPQRVVERLVSSSLDSGGHDNITAVCIRIGKSDGDDDEDTLRLPPVG